MKTFVKNINLSHRLLIKVLLALGFLGGSAPFKNLSAAAPVRVIILPPVLVGESGSAPNTEAEGVARALEYEIAVPGNIDIVPRQDVARYRQVQAVPAGTELTFDQAFELARMAGARFVIWGNYQKSGDAYRFNMVVGDAPAGTVRKLRSTRTDLFGIQDDLSAQAKKLIVHGGEPMPMESAVSAPAAIPLSTTSAEPAKRKPAAPDPRRQARELFNQGVRLGDYSDRERDLYVKATELDPNFAEPYYALGELYFQRQQSPEALAAFETYIRKRPNAPEAVDVRTVIAELRKQLGKPEASLPDAPAARGTAQSAPVASQTAESATSSFPSDEQKSWSAGHWFNEGLKLEQSDHGRYVQYLNQALKVDPTFAAAYYNLGYDCYERNEYREARAYFEKYIELSPNSSDAPQIRQILDALKNY